MRARRLHLVRHGAAEGAEGRAVGRVDLPLSAAGRAAVERLAASWQGPPPGRLVSSPLARADETAALLAAAWGLAPPQREPRLAEMSFGDWDGRAWDEIHAADGTRLAAWGERWWQAATPGGESFADLVRRVTAWWDELWDEPWGELPAGEEGEAAVTVAVTHAGPLRALLGSRLGVPRDELWSLALGTARVTTVEAAPGAAARLLALDRPSFL